MYYLVLLLIVKVCTSTFVANVYVGYHHPRAYCTTSATVYIYSLLQLLQCIIISSLRNLLHDMIMIMAEMVETGKSHHDVTR